MARIQGYVDSIGYRDGAFVDKGTPLFTIEPAPYRAQLDQAKATLASAVAKAEFSERQYKRYADLARTDSTSRQQAEQTLSDRDADHAAVMQAHSRRRPTRIIGLVKNAVKSSSLHDRAMRRNDWGVHPRMRRKPGHIR
jgi:multidrug resistance efflux pump